MSSERSAEVVIIGGGVYGCAIAWELARRGVKDVLVLEREGIGTQSTAKAASVLTNVASTAAKGALFQETWAAMPTLEGELGESLGVEVKALPVLDIDPFDLASAVFYPPCSRHRSIRPCKRSFLSTFQL